MIRRLFLPLLALLAAAPAFASYKESGNLVLVTHDVNIRALAGTSVVGQGKMGIASARPDGTLSVHGVLSVAGAR